MTDVLHPGAGAGLAAVLALGGLLAWQLHRGRRLRRAHLADAARRDGHARALRAISVACASDAPDVEVLATLVDLFRPEPGPSACAIVLRAGEDGTSGPRTVSTGAASLDLRALESEAVRWGEGSLREAPLATRDPARPVRLDPALPCQAVVRLAAEGTDLGAVVVEAADEAILAPAALADLATLAGHAALELRSRERRTEAREAARRAERRAETLERVLALAGRLRPHLSQQQVLDETVRGVSTELGFPGALVSLVDRSESALVPRAHSGLEDLWPALKERRVPAPEAGALPPAGSPAPCPRAGLLEPGAPGHPADVFLVPLLSAQQLVGLLEVAVPPGRAGVDPERVRAVETFAAHAATAIQAARAYEVTRLVSARDSLTGACNHRAFQETLYREVGRHQRSGMTLALALLDLDDFKAVNDRWGHPAGDAVLRTLVDELRKGVREADTVARYGGEEFAVIFPEASAEKAEALAERIRARMASLALRLPGAPGGVRVTVSIGIAVFPEDAASKDELIARADEALYAAKRAGKDRVVRAERSGAPVLARA